MQVTVTGVFTGESSPTDDVYMVTTDVKGYDSPMSIQADRTMSRGITYSVTLPSASQCQNLYNHNRYPVATNIHRRVV